MRNDPGTSFRYPTLGNYCCHCQPPAVAHLEHQEAYCFRDAYPECPVYRQPASQPLPIALKANIRSHHRPLRKLVILVLALLLLIAAWKTLLPQRGAAGQSNPVTASSTHLIPVSGPDTPVPTDPPVPTPSNTRISPTGTPFQPDALQQAAFHSRAYVLEIPVTIGEHSFLLHRVHEGESFDVLEITYVTTRKVLLRLNASLSPPLRAGSVIVIVPGLQTADPELPAFQPYQVSDEEISMDDLAQKLEVEPSLLRDFNPCSRTCRLTTGNWVLVPYPEK